MFNFKTLIFAVTMSLAIGGGEGGKAQAAVCPAIPTINRPIALPVYQSDQTENRYFNFIVEHTNLHYFTAYVRDRAEAYEADGDVGNIACMTNVLYSYAVDDPFADFIFNDGNAQAVIEIDNTIRQLAYIYKQYRPLIQKYSPDAVKDIDAYLVEKTEFLGRFFVSNRHAKLYKNWHDLTKMVVGSTVGNETFIKDAREGFFNTFKTVVGMMSTAEVSKTSIEYDRAGSVANYYKQNINSMVAMAELDKTLYSTQYSTGMGIKRITLDKIVDKFLNDMHDLKQELYVKFPEDFDATNVPSRMLGEITDNVQRLRYQHDHRTHMAWLYTYNKNRPTAVISEAYAKYADTLQEDHVGVVVK